MRRDIDYLADNHQNVLIIGGGIHGCAIFRQLAETGIRTALVEKEDFGSETSANSLKILHGGLRYLQHLNIRRIRDSVYSRKAFMRIAPHLIQPLPCVIPTSGRGIKGKSVMAIALKLFDLLSWDRNEHAPIANRAGRTTLLSSEQLKKLVPHLALKDITGGALWYDDLIVNTERMCLSFVKAGCAAGGVAANYARVNRLVRKDNRITGAEMTDRLSGRSCTVTADMVINVAGPWVDELRKDSQQTGTIEELAKAVNIVIDRQLFTGHGVGLESSDATRDRDSRIKRSNRLFFFVPWKDHTIIGTTYSHYTGRCDKLVVEDGEIDDIINEVNSIYPDAQLDRSNVIHSHAGLLPARKPKAGNGSDSPQLHKHSKLIDHETHEGLAGLITIEGVKYTTAPAIALQVEKLLRKKAVIAGGPLNTSIGTTAQNSLSDIGNSKLLHQYPHLRQNYGGYSAAIVDLAKREMDSAEPVTRDRPLLKAEVRYAVREEMAMKLSDVVLRRTDCGSDGCPSHSELEQIAALMAGELGWSEDRQIQEIEQLRSYYHNRPGRQP